MRFLGALTILLTACGRGAPTPVPAPDPYPLRAGARWTYRSELGASVVREIPRTVERDGRIYFEMIFRLPLLGDRPLLLRKAPEGVVANHGGREQTILHLPLQPGRCWRIDFPDQEIADCTVEGEEDRTVLGERRRCVRLRVARTPRSGGRSTTDFEWYADGIGLAAMRVTFAGVTQTFSLESYER